MAYYALHKFHWRPTTILEMSRREKSFILAAIQLKVEEDEKQNKKLQKTSGKRPRKR